MKKMLISKNIELSDYTDEHITSVDKKDIAGVTEIVPQQHVETLSEGSVYVLNGDEVRFRRPSESCE